MRILLFLVFSTLLIGGCSNRVTSAMAEQVTLYREQSAIPKHCEQLGEVSTRVCANTTPLPTEVMIKNLREKAFIDYDADAVWLFNIGLSGSEVVGQGIAYQCKE